MNYHWSILTLDERKLIEARQVIQAIKNLRARLNLGLKESKDICDSYLKYLGHPSIGYYSESSKYVVTFKTSLGSVIKLLVEAASRNEALLTGVKAFKDFSKEQVSSVEIGNL